MTTTSEFKCEKKQDKKTSTSFTLQSRKMNEFLRSTTQALNFVTQWLILRIYFSNPLEISYHVRLMSCHLMRFCMEQSQVTRLMDTTVHN